MEIESRHCNGCAQTFKALIQKEPGVRMAEVSYKDGEARVMYDPHAVSEERLAEVIAKPGYRVVSQS